ncbi:MAG TPA: hypothetical protein H9881_10225 [Candidatus Stackebrandtia excrementipullorum]|nr:hypothetical protein [Candidatus Stackebrandtia excrementipullorum]
MPSEHSSVAPEPDAPRSRTGLVIIALTVIATGFLGAMVIGGTWLVGQWDSGRSSPTESVDGFLTALLVDRDSQDAASFTCQSLTGDLTEAMNLLDSLPPAGSPEAALVGFTWDNVTELSRSDDTAVVTADVTLDITGETARWNFALVTGDPDDTWRVCGVVTGGDT